jgi:hypothetical protein
MNGQYGFAPQSRESLCVEKTGGLDQVGASGKEMSDATRYRMCGNGVVANVAEYIARRIAEVLT